MAYRGDLCHFLGKTFQLQLGGLKPLKSPSIPLYKKGDINCSCLIYLRLSQIGGIHWALSDKPRTLCEGKWTTTFIFQCRNFSNSYTLKYRKSSTLLRPM